MSILKQLSIPEHDTWAINHVNQLASQNQLSPTIIRALKFYDKYQHLLEDDGTLPALVDKIQILIEKVDKLEGNNPKVVYESEGNQEIDSNEWLDILEEME